MKNIKRIILFLFLPALMLAQDAWMNADLWKLSGTALTPVKSTWTLTLPATTFTTNIYMAKTTSTAGIIYSNGTRFIHSYDSNDSSSVIGRNIFIGLDAGNFTSGARGGATTLASFNNGFGYQALKAITTAANNNAMGYSALSKATTGGGNTAIGTSVLGNNVDGVNNIGIGTSSMYTNISGNYNVAVGNGSLQSSTASNNTAIGYLALNLNTASNNVAVGSNALRQTTTGTDNTAVGRSSQLNNVDGYSNASVGTSALISNISGYKNTTVGAISLYLNTIGWGNTALGWNAMHDMVDGIENTAVGVSSMINNVSGNYNSAIGGGAFEDMTLGSNNTANGFRSIQHVLLGDYNTGVGAYCGQTITGGATSLLYADSSIYVGAQTKAKADNAINETVIGTGATGAGSNTVTIGNANVTDVYLSEDSAATVHAGSANFNGGLTIAGKLTQANQSAIAGTITSDYSVVYPYDDGSNVKVMALLDDAGTETTTQVATANMWGEPSGGAILDGTTQHYSHVDNANVDFGAGSFSLEWYGKINTALAYQGLIQKYANPGWCLYITPANVVGMYFRDGGGEEYQTVGATALSLNIPYHIVAVYSSSASTVSVYVNGVLDKAPTTMTKLLSKDNSSTLNIGKSDINGVLYSLVTVYSAKTHNRVLTQAEVTKRWNNGQPHLYVEPYATKGASQTDLVTNGDVEIAIPTINGVSITNVRSTSAQSVEQAHAGSNSVKITSDGTASNTFYTIYSASSVSTPLLSNKTYEMSVWVYLPSGQTGFTTLSLQNKIKGVIEAIANTTTTDAWVKLTGTFTPNYLAADFYASITSNSISDPTGYYFYWDDLTVKTAGETFSIANTDWGASGAVCTIGGTKSIANATAFPIAVPGKYDARKTITADYAFTGTAKVGSILKYIKIKNTIADPDTISLGSSAGGTQVLSSQIIGSDTTAVVNVAKWFSDSAVYSLYLSGDNWTGDNLEVVFIYEPIAEKL